jgi:GC-rich sequence DNA-binding factor
LGTRPWQVSTWVRPLFIPPYLYSTQAIDEPESANFIPSESSIKVAKERRERLRKTGGEDDFISLTVSRREEDHQGPHPESRLVREEDELGDGDDGKFALSQCLPGLTWNLEFAEYTSAQDRIALGKKSRKKEAANLRDSMKEMIADAYVHSFKAILFLQSSSEEEDEETTEWENEQLRRGGHRDLPSSSTPKQTYQPTPSSLHIDFDIASY